MRATDLGEGKSEEGFTGVPRDSIGEVDTEGTLVRHEGECPS